MVRPINSIYLTLDGGLNVTDNPNKCELNHATVSRDIEYHEDKQFSKRHGFTTAASASSFQSRGLHRYLLSNQTEYLCTQGSNGKFYRWNTTGWADNTNATATYATGTSYLSQSRVFNDLLFVCDNTNFYKWDGSSVSNKTATVTGSPPSNVIDVESWLDRLWAITKDSTNLYWSDNKNGQSWDAINNFTPVKYKSSYNVAIRAGESYLYIFKPDSVYSAVPNSNIDSLTGTTPTLAGIHKILDVGIRGKKTLVRCSYGFIWSDGQTVWLWDEQNKPVEVGRVIKTDLQGCNYSYTKYATARWDAKRCQYLLSVPYGTSQTTNNRVYVMTLSENGVKWSYYNLQANDLETSYQIDSKSRLFYASTSQLFKDGTSYNDGGTAISATLKSKWFEPKDFDINLQTAHLEYLRLIVDGVGDWNLKVGIEIDYGGTEYYTVSQYSGGFIIGTSVIGVDKIGGGTDISHEQRFKGKLFKHLRIVISNTTVDQYFTVKGLEIGVVPGGR